MKVLRPLSFLLPPDLQQHRGGSGCFSPKGIPTPKGLSEQFFVLGFLPLHFAVWQAILWNAGRPSCRVVWRAPSSLCAL